MYYICIVYLCLLHCFLYRSCLLVLFLLLPLPSKQSSPHHILDILDVQDGRPIPKRQKMVGMANIRAVDHRKKRCLLYQIYPDITLENTRYYTVCGCGCGQAGARLRDWFFFRTMLNGWRIQSAIKRNGLFQPIPKGNNQIGASESVCQFFLYLFETTKKSTYSQAHDTE